MGQPAARISDMHTCPMVTPGTPPIPHVGGPILPPGCPTVMIGGLPAARVGDMAVCVGPPDSIVVGAFTVLIGNMPAARMGDQTAHGGVIVLGCPTVLIGESGSGSGGGGGMPTVTLAAAFKNAAESGAALVAANNAAAGPMTDAEAQAFMDSFKKTDIPFDYPTDCCYARARKMCAILERDGRSCEKFWYGGNLGRADLRPHKPDGSVVTFPDPSHQISWRYHVAPLVSVRHNDGRVEKMVLDPSLSAKPLSKADWKTLVGTSSDPREYTSDSKLGFPWNRDGSVASADSKNIMDESGADSTLREHRDNRDAALHR